MSAVTTPGAAGRDDEHVRVERVALEVVRVRVADRDGRIRLQEQMRDRLADDVAAADDDRAGAVERDLVLGEQRHDPERRRRHVRRPPEVELARVERVDAVDVLDRVDRARSRAPRRGRPGAGAGRGSRRRRRRRSARRRRRRSSSCEIVRGQLAVDRAHPGLGARPRACGGCRSSEAGSSPTCTVASPTSPSSRDLVGDPGADPLGERPAFHQRRRQATGSAARRR